MNNFFKTAFLFLGICLILVLFGIYVKMDNSRYQLSMSNNGAIIIDTHTGEVYDPVPGGFKDYNKDDNKTLKELP